MTNIENTVINFCLNEIKKYTYNSAGWNGWLNLFLPYGTLRPCPKLARNDGSMKSFIEIGLDNYKNRLLIEINFSEITDFTNPIYKQIKSKKSLNIVHIYNLNLAVSQSAKVMCRLLGSTNLVVNLIKLSFSESLLLSVDDFSYLPWRSLALRQINKHFQF